MQSSFSWKGFRNSRTDPHPRTATASPRCTFSHRSSPALISLFMRLYSLLGSQSERSGLISRKMSLSLTDTCRYPNDSNFAFRWRSTSDSGAPTAPTRPMKTSGPCLTSSAMSMHPSRRRANRSCGARFPHSTSRQSGRQHAKRLSDHFPFAYIERQISHQVNMTKSRWRQTFGDVDDLTSAIRARTAKAALKRTPNSLIFAVRAGGTDSQRRSIALSTAARGSNSDQAGSFAISTNWRPTVSTTTATFLS